MMMTMRFGGAARSMATVGASTRRLLEHSQVDYRRADEMKGQVTVDATRAVYLLKKHRDEADKVMKATFARLLRDDLVSALDLLRRQQEVDLAMKVFSYMRKEPWYKPSPNFYSTMMNFAARHSRLGDLTLLVDELQNEGLEPTADMFTPQIKNCLLRGDYASCVKFYELMKTSGYGPDASFYAALISKKQVVGAATQKPSYSFRVLVRGHCTCLVQKRFLHDKAKRLDTGDVQENAEAEDPEQQQPQLVHRQEKMRLISLEAVAVVDTIKRAKGDRQRLDAVIKAKTSRMVKADLLCVLWLLQQHQEVDLAFKIFKVARKETWYKPNILLFRPMIALLLKHRRFDDAWDLMDELEEEGLEPTSSMFSSAIISCMDADDDFETAMKFYWRLQRTKSVKPNPRLFKAFISRLVDAQRPDIADLVEKDFVQFVDEEKKRGITVVMEEEHEDRWSEYSDDDGPPKL